MCKFIGKSNERILCKLSKSEILRLYSIVHVAMETTKTSHFTSQSKSFISIFSLAKFQYVSCNLSFDMIWQMTYTHKLPKQCSATLNNCPDMSASCLLGSQSEHRIRWLVETQYPLWFSCRR